MRKTKLAKPARRGGSAVSGIMPIIAVVLVLAIIVAAGVIFIPRLTHTCDNCGHFFFGTGYYANAVTNALTDWAGADSKILCLDCAVTEHALAIATGKSISDFERPLFEFLEESAETEGD